MPDGWWMALDDIKRGWQKDLLLSQERRRAQRRRLGACLLSTARAAAAKRNAQTEGGQQAVRSFKLR
jgi:hypothetical protein